MHPIKSWLIKKLILLTDSVKWIKKKGTFFICFIQKKIQTKKSILLAFINQTAFLNKSIYFIQLFLNKIPFINKLLSIDHKKHLSLLPLALLTSLFIFYFMSVLISTKKSPNKTSSQSISINFLLNTQIDELELRSRLLPKKPKKEDPPPKTPKLKIQQTEIQKPEMVSQLPQLELPDDFQSDAKGAAVSAHGNQDREVTPIFRIQAIYPRQAALRNIEGFVILQFDITATGHTDNVTVLQASPPQIFNSSAIQALKKWKYKPKIENGKAVRQNNLKVQLDFNLQGK